MKVRSLILGLVLVPALAFGQAIDNALYVKAFPGSDIATKVKNAMASCNTDPLNLCLLVIDPSLSKLATGTMPTLATNEYLVDWRTFPPTYTTASRSSLPVPVGPAFPVSPANGLFVVTSAVSTTDCVGSSGIIVVVCVATPSGPQPVGGSSLLIPGLSSDGSNGINVTANINPGSVGSVLYVGPSSGYTVASAVAALASTGGSVLTAPNYTETITNLSLGTTTKPVTLKLGQGTNLTITGTTGIQIFNGSSIVCDSWSPAACTITGAATGGTASQLITNGAVGTQQYFNLKGLFISCTSTITYTNGCVYVNGVFATSSIEDSVITRFANSIGLHLTSTVSTGGGTNVFWVVNTWVDGASNTGARPTVLDATGSGVLSAVNFVAGASENPGVGNYAFEVNGHGVVKAVLSIGLYGHQIQGNASNTVASFYAVDVESLKISNMLFNNQPTGYPCVELNQTVTNGLSAVDADTIRCSNFANTPAVKNDVSGYQTASTIYLETHYFYSGGANAEPITFDGPTNLYPKAVGTHVKLTGQTSSISNQTLLASAPTALYRICVTVLVTSTTATGGTIVGIASYNNGNGGNNYQVTGSVAAQTQWSENASNNAGCRTFRPIASSTIFANSSDAATGGTATYTFEATLEQLTAN